MMPFASADIDTIDCVLDCNDGDSVERCTTLTEDCNGRQAVCAGSTNICSSTTNRSAILRRRDLHDAVDHVRNDENASARHRIGACLSFASFDIVAAGTIGIGNQAPRR